MLSNQSFSFNTHVGVKKSFLICKVQQMASPRFSVMKSRVSWFSFLGKAGRNRYQKVVEGEKEISYKKWKIRKWEITNSRCWSFPPRSQKGFCWLHWSWVPAETAEGYSSGALQQQGFTIGNRFNHYQELKQRNCRKLMWKYSVGS